MRRYTDLIRLFKPANLLLFVLSLMVIFLTLTLLLSKTNYPPYLPLWYSRPWGLDRLTPPVTLYVVPALALIFLIINHYLANLFSSSNLALSKLLIWTALATALIGLIAIHKTLLLI